MSWFLGGCCSVQVAQPPLKDAGVPLVTQAPQPQQADVKSTPPIAPAALAATAAPLSRGPQAVAVGAASQTTTANPVPTPSPLILPTKQADQQEMCETATTKNTSRSACSGASSLGTEFMNDRIPAHQQQVAKIQSQMKHFVKGMMRGREMSVLSVDGQLRECTCNFDRKLRNYSIVINKETRVIALSRFKEVFQGLEPDDIATPLDELCTTFVLDNGECLSFRFKDVAERENFAMCLQIIVDGHQS